MALNHAKHHIWCKNMNHSQNSMTNSFHVTTLVFFVTPWKEKTSTAGIYLFKVNNRNTRTIYEIYSKLTIKTPKWSQWRHSGAFIVNFEHILHIALLFLLLTLKSKCQLGVRWNGWRSLYLNFYKQCLISPFHWGHAY